MSSSINSDDKHRDTARLVGTVAAVGVAPALTPALFWALVAEGMPVAALSCVALIQSAAFLMSRL